MESRCVLELYKKYRPKSLKTIYGQPQAVSVLQNFFSKKQVPHVILFSGPTGTGKTTLAKICSRELGLSRKSMDLTEMNSSSFRGIDTVRDIESRINLKGFDGGNRVYIFDEAHQLTSAAQDGLLKVLEDTPDHVWFFICTTDPHKLKPALRNRCTKVELKRLTQSTMKELIDYILKKEKQKVKKDVIEAIVEKAEGSPRQALVLLESVIGIKDEDEALSIVDAVNEQNQEFIEFPRLLFPYKGKPKWADFAGKFKDIQESDIETIRHITLSYACSILEKGGPMAGRASLTIQVFSDPFYDSKKAGLVQAFFEVVSVKN